MKKGIASGKLKGNRKTEVKATKSSKDLKLLNNKDRISFKK